MWRLLSFLFFGMGSVVASKGVAQVLREATPYVATLLEDDLKGHINVLTSDSLAGRETGEEGQRKAARYLAAKFKAMGLAPADFPNGEKSYMQPFILKKHSWRDVFLEIGTHEYTHLKDMLYLSNSSRMDSQHFDVLLADSTAPFTDTLSLQTSLIAYTAPSTSDWRSHAAKARKQGAIGAVIFVDDKIFKKEIKGYKRYLRSRFYLSGSGKGKAEELAIVLPNSAFKYFFGVSVKQQGTASKRLASINCKAESHEEKIYTENVVGVIQGKEQPDEWLVLSAHYDHLGVRDGQIYRGADDNGSGVAALLEIAEAFSLAAQRGDRPKRSLLFIAMTGEEKGLLGSDYYTQQPIYPLAHTVANLNIDMIGRTDKAHTETANYVYLIGADKLSSELHKLSEEVNNKHTKLLLDYRYNDEKDPNRFYYRSDHYNFAKHNIPVIFYFSGVHEDYHQPSDTPDKLLMGKYLRIVKLVFRTAWEIANRADRLRVDKAPPSLKKGF